MSLDYPAVQAIDADDDNPTAELQEEYDMSDPDRSKIFSSVESRYILFERLTTKDV